MKIKLLDTNIIIRAFTRDNRAQALKARGFLVKLEDGYEVAMTTPLIISEVIYVLTGKIYKQDRVDVSEALFDLITLNNLKIDNKEILKNAVTIYKDSNNLDFIDAYNISIILESKDEIEILSFDKDYDKYDIKRIEP